jgi:hypothetical protein
MPAAGVNNSLQMNCSARESVRIIQLSSYSILLLQISWARRKTGLLLLWSQIHNYTCFRHWFAYYIIYIFYIHTNSKNTELTFKTFPLMKFTICRILGYSLFNLFFYDQRLYGKLLLVLGLLWIGDSLHYLEHHHHPYQVL